MLTIEALTEEIDHLKPVSQVAGKVMSLLDDPDSGISELSDIIRHEPALTADVLKLANSSYFGLPGKIDDAKQAIVYLGMTQVVELVLLVTCANNFQGVCDGYGLKPGELWRNAVSGAIIAHDLSQIKGLKHSSLVFSGALLRDIGKVVLNQYVRRSMEPILKRVVSQCISFREAERQVLGVDHNQVGAMVVKRWHFPLPLQCIIRDYHTPFEAQGCFLEASIVHLADAICRKMDIGVGMDDGSYSEDERVARSLGLRDAQIENVIDGFGKQMERVEVLFAQG